MGLFGIFKSNKPKTHKGFHFLNVSSVDALTKDTVKVTFTIDQDLKSNYRFKAGQYVDLIAEINGKEERRSYSICSGEGEALAVAVKRVEKGIFSNWIADSLKSEMEIQVSEPNGNFILDDQSKNIVAIAAGSGITPILSIAKAIEKREGNLRLYYGNRTHENIIFKNELENLKHTFVTWFLSGETVDGFETGRIDKDNFTSIIKSDLSLLRADAYYICGPEEMIVAASEVLKFFGVSEKKIHYELFTPPVLMKSKVNTAPIYEGTSKVKVILFDEVAEFELEPKGKTILSALEKEGLDAPYSCKGGVCSSCKAKVTEGSAYMDNNFSLSDEEVKAGYILTCQAHPNSETVIISYDA
jgi:ring-1,2-phenylacetyl-CoA epoxidase subunit PaaE